MGRSIWAGDASRPSPATVASSDLLLVTEAPSRRGAHAEFPTPSGLPNIIFPPRPGTRDAASPRGLQAPDLQSRGQEKLPPSCPKHTRRVGPTILVSLDFPSPRARPFLSRNLPVGAGAISSDGGHGHPWQKMLAEMEDLQRCGSEPEPENVVYTPQLTLPFLLPCLLGSSLLPAHFEDEETKALRG